jgi:V/A-type H+-transporting ATPase subunit D
MAKLQFSKAALHHQSALLKRYKQVLPALDLKRKQLTVEKIKAISKQEKTAQLIAQRLRQIGEFIPMLSDRQIDLSSLVQVDHVVVSDENVVGVHLPFIETLKIKVRHYSFMTKPHWVDQLVIQLHKMLALRIQLQIDRRRVELLQQATNKVTQRVNLFDKVLIPRAQENIKKIRIYLSDAERASVVRAKITKKKRLLREI